MEHTFFSLCQVRCCPFSVLWSSSRSSNAPRIGQGNRGREMCSTRPHQAKQRIRMYFSLSPPKRNIRALETPPRGYSCTSPSRHKSSKQKTVINRAGEGVRMGLCVQMRSPIPASQKARPSKQRSLWMRKDKDAQKRTGRLHAKGPTMIT